MKVTAEQRGPVSVWLHAYWIELVIGVSGIALINAILIPKAFRQTHTVNPESAAQLGSFVGGYIGSLFALISVLLLFRTLKNQLRTSEVQHFETKYFELLKMHRDNVAELDLQDSSGPRVFVLMIRELRCILNVMQEERGTNALTQRQRMHIAYYCLLFGVGPNSSRMLKMSLSEFPRHLIESIEGKLNTKETKALFQEERHFGYVPFEGHQSRLGHYYRHLYQMVRYVDETRIKFTPREKYEYGKTIRAQLSTHEQALLLINSLTPMGKTWWDKGLIVQYKLVRNIPRDFFDPSTELDVGPLFESDYFEWEEVVGSTK